MACRGTSARVSKTVCPRGFIRVTRLLPSVWDKTLPAEFSRRYARQTGPDADMTPNGVYLIPGLTRVINEDPFVTLPDSWPEPVTSLSRWPINSIQPVSIQALWSAEDGSIEFDWCLSIDHSVRRSAVESHNEKEVNQYLSDWVKSHMAVGFLPKLPIRDFSVPYVHYERPVHAELPSLVLPGLNNGLLDHWF